MSVVDFICEKYPNTDKKSMELVYKTFPEKFIVIQNGKIDLAAFYYTLDDNTFNKIKEGKLKITDLRNAERLIRSKGKNIHFGICASRGWKPIREGIREVIKRENPKTISWFKKDLSKLNIFTRRKLCLN